MKRMSMLIRWVPKAKTWASGVLLVMALALAGWAVAEPPSFDFEKAKQLTPEKRREYDVIFANEMDIRDSNSNRYIDEFLATHPEEEAKQIGSHYQRRYEEVSAMAADGYLPAYVALRVLDLRTGRRIEDAAALKMLLDAATQGDLSASCSMFSLGLIKEFVYRTLGSKEAWEQAIVKGAELKHGRCLAIRGSRTAWRFEKRADGVAPVSFLAEVDKALPDLFESARQGYYVAHRTLHEIRWTQLQQKDYQISGPVELERLLCWGRLAQQHANAAHFDATISELTGYLARGLPKEEVEQFPLGLRPKISAEYLPLIDQYRPSKVPITRKVATPERCIELEHQFAQTESKGARP
jgi:hypothetical protein